MSKIKPGVKVADLSPRQQEAFATPGNFARSVLKMPTTPKQHEILEAFAPNRARVSVVCCNEAGKTTKIICALILWHITVFPRRGENGGVTVTSGSWPQIKTQLMPALRSYANAAGYMKSWDFMDTEIKRGGEPNLMTYSVAQAGRAEGFHGSLESPLMMIVDEAKSVSDAIIRAAEDRCRPQRMGLLSSPGFAMGKFYESHSTEAAYWKRFKMTVEDCPWVDRAEMRRVIARSGGGDYEKGLQDPFIRSAYFAEHMPFVQGSLLSLAEIEECLADPPGRRPGERHGFCDFAAGGDENVFALRLGNRVEIRDAWRDKNTMSAVGRFVQNFQRAKEECGLRPDEIEGDNDGLGNPMVSRLQEVGWPILPFHSNARALDAQRFRNRSSELWFSGVEQIQNRQIILPDDPDLKGQLVDRVGKAESSGRRWIESKEDLFRRQARDQRPQRSPDRADAVLGAMGALPLLGPQAVQCGNEQAQRWGPYVGEEEDATAGMSVPEEALRGFDAGG